ncbi:hypothetical protein ACJRO7_032558 [Eucalyptus globulus]|uniref:Pectinesterase inhibitor domain-containing protein n=1 Tax=Eucalyptus globulus TaxID=34317 RepID=A0ABD3JIB1_EUCGL
MKTPMLFTLVSFTQLLLITILPPASADLIDDTCKKMPDVDSCIAILRSDPRSSTADTPTLGLISVDTADSNAEVTLDEIKDLLGKSPDSKTKQALTSCEASYGNIRSSLVPPSRESLTKGDYKFAVQYMNDAANAAAVCEAGFGGPKSPIYDANMFERNAGLLASAIASSLL